MGPLSDFIPLASILYYLQNDVTSFNWKILFDFSDFKFRSQFPMVPFNMQSFCINFPFKGLGGGPACMAIDCLYSLDGGQLSLTRGKFLLYKHSQF